MGRRALLLVPIALAGCGGADRPPGDVRLAALPRALVRSGAKPPVRCRTVRRGREYRCALGVSSVRVVTRVTVDPSGSWRTDSIALPSLHPSDDFAPGTSLLGCCLPPSHR